MGVACITLRLSLRKWGYSGHLQWYNVSKSPTIWENLYLSGVLGMGGTIFSREGENFTEIVCPAQGTWLGKFMIWSKLWM